MAVRFMMLMPWGRVGSNLLFSILRQSGSMKLVNENLIKLRSPEEQSAWFNEFYEIGLAVPSSHHIGSKQNIRAIRDFRVFERLLRENSVRVVRLRRDNCIKAAVSQIRAEAYAKKTEREGGVGLWAVKRGSNPLGPTAIDPELLLRRAKIMEECQLEMLKAFSGYEVLDIEYEEVNSDLRATVGKLRSFLAVSEVDYSVPFEKATPDHLSSAITNFDEVREYLRKTPYGDFF